MNRPLHLLHRRHGSVHFPIFRIPPHLPLSSRPLAFHVVPRIFSHRTLASQRTRLRQQSRHLRLGRICKERPPRWPARSVLLVPRPVVCSHLGRHLRHTQLRRHDYPPRFHGVVYALGTRDGGPSRQSRPQGPSECTTTFGLFPQAPCAHYSHFVVFCGDSDSVSIRVYGCVHCADCDLY